VDALQEMKNATAPNSPPLPDKKRLIIVGLEIGTTKVCAAVGEIKPDDTLNLLGVGQAPSRGVRKGEIVDFDSAQKSVVKALVDAEEKCDVMIKNVYLAITGSHISSLNNRVSAIIPKEQEEIGDADCERVRESAKGVSLPAQNNIIHSILQHYWIDGQEGILNPVGLMGSLLEAGFHIIHGVRTRIQSPIRCVNELDVEVEDVVFGPYAAAQAILNQNQKNLGAVVIDFGGGTTDYIVYADGVVKQSGVVSVGGDDIKTDISTGLRTPLAIAEKLNIDEGSVMMDQNLSDNAIVLKREFGFAGREIERKTLNAIIYTRIRETLIALRKRIAGEQDFKLIQAGIFLTGGISLVKGIGQLAERIFEMPVHLPHTQAMEGASAAAKNPQFSAAIGLLIYGQRTGGHTRFRK